MFEFQAGVVYSREALAALMGTTDRCVRENIRALRRRGVPIVALRDGGYKLAETAEEKISLINMYESRIIDEAGTLRRLRRAMQVDGQTKMERRMKAYENTGRDKGAAASHCQRDSR